MNVIKKWCIAAALLTASHSFANQQQSLTIYESAVKWEDQAGVGKLLAVIPTWQHEDIKSIFELYIHPEKSRLSEINGEKYNIRFVNVYWGPLDNPFNKLPRPAKIFVILKDEKNNYQYNMAPVMHDKSDNDYYVFDKNQIQPVRLHDWINSIKQANQQQKSMLINVCNAYGNYPNDVCNEKSYQDESEDSHDEKGNELKITREKVPSAARDLQQDWHAKLSSIYHLEKFPKDTIIDQSVLWKDVTARNKLLETVVAWPNINVIQHNFEKIRNIRYAKDTVYVDFLRRITWLFPDDGCWTRASAVIKDLFGPYHNLVNDFARPSKVFAFGNLCANTPNHVKGYVAWWYHTAPMIRDAETNQSYVLDPSVNPYTPLTVEKWMEEISSHSGACSRANSFVEKFSVCNGYGPNPFNYCEDEFVTEFSAAVNQSTYRAYEYKRQLVLGRDPQQVLGDSPPWS